MQDILFDIGELQRILRRCFMETGRDESFSLFSTSEGRGLWVKTLLKSTLSWFLYFILLPKVSGPGLGDKGMTPLDCETCTEMCQKISGNTVFTVCIEPTIGEAT